MKKLLLLVLFLSTGLIGMEEGAAASPSGHEKEIIQTSELINLPAEIQLNIIERLIENAKDLKSLKEVLKSIASLKNTSKQFADLLEYEDPETKSPVHKNILKKILAEQIKNNNIQVDLFTAAELRSPLLAELLIDQGVDPNKRYLPVDMKSETPLHKAAQHNALGVAKVLIDKGAKLNARVWNEQFTPLHIAGIFNSVDVAKLLVEKGADLYAESEFSTEDGPTPYDWSKEGVKKVLNEVGLGIKLAIKRNDLNEIFNLIEQGADINAQDKEGITPLRIAVRESSVDIIKTLIDAKADVNSMDKKGITPLRSAIKNEKVEAASMLIKNGANVEDAGVQRQLKGASEEMKKAIEQAIKEKAQSAAQSARN